MLNLNNIGTTEIIIIGIVLVVLFGGKALSDMAGQLGKTSKEYKKTKKEVDDVLHGNYEENEKKETSEVGEVVKEESTEKPVEGGGN